VKLKIIIIFVAVIVTATICGTVFFYFMSLYQRPTVEVPPKILSSNNFWTNVTENIRFYTIVGEIAHDLTKNIKSVNVTATFYDANNNVIGNATGHPVIEIIKPGLRSPFVIYWKPVGEPPEGYELTLVYENTTEKPVNELKVVSHSNKTDDNGYYIVEGEVLNVEWGVAIGPRLYCSYYNSEGNITFLSGVMISSKMDVREKSYFVISSQPYKIHPAAYRLLVIPHHYEGLPIARFDLVLILIAAFITFVVYMKRRGW